MESNIQILSYGGGVQSVAMIVLCLQEKLPLPDKIIFADTSREKTSTFEYLNNLNLQNADDLDKYAWTEGNGDGDRL